MLVTIRFETRARAAGNIDLQSLHLPGLLSNTLQMFCMDSMISSNDYRAKWPSSIWFEIFLCLYMVASMLRIVSFIFKISLSTSSLARLMFLSSGDPSVTDLVKNFLSRLVEKIISIPFRPRVCVISHDGKELTATLKWILIVGQGKER